MSFPKPLIITDDYIRTIYKTPGHPVAFSAPGAIYKFFNGAVSLDFITNALESIESYTLHREFKQPAIYNPYFAYERRNQFQADLIDITNLKHKNNQITFLLVIIDVFTRKLWVMPLKRKTAAETCRGLESWINHLQSENDKPSHILTDNGKEFVNRCVKNLFVRYDISHHLSKNINKAAIAERVNKSLQILIYKYLTENSTLRYIDVLPHLVQTYNNRQHRTLNKYSPNEADDPINEVKIRSIHFARYQKIVKKKRNAKQTFKVGDRVRIKSYVTGLSSRRRAYAKQFNEELFIIHKINKRMPVIMYEIQSMMNDEIIEGGFYANELVHVRGNIFKIDRVLKTVGKGNAKKYLVRWKNLSPRWDKWVSSIT